MVRFKKKKSRSLIKNACTSLIERLKDEGFIVQLYESYSSNSVYLKLDYGVSNSIRISDHRGKAYLDYRFNLLTSVTEKSREVSERGFVKDFYPITDLDDLMKDIVEHRKERLDKYGTIRYQKYMDKNIKEYDKLPGFWSKSVVV